MKKILCIALVIALCAFSTFSALALTEAEAKQQADAVTNTSTDSSLVTSPFISVIANVKNSVVGVNNYQNTTYYSSNYGFGWGFGYGYGGRTPATETVERLAATGSGTVVYNGMVLTNYHVIEDATRLTISVLDDETEYEATVLTSSEAQDLAVLYVPELTLAPVPLGDSDKLQVGEWAICIGNPLSAELAGTTTVGIISGLDRSIGSTTTTDKYGLKTTVTNTMIQTDSAINSGNSGGGLFNTLGQLMGIPSMKYSGSSRSSASIEGIGMAIPVNTAKPYINEAIVMVLSGEIEAPAKKDTSSAPAAVSADKPMLGITISEINASTNYAVYTGVLPGGLLISEVSENGPAAAAGIQPFDIIVEVDGELASSTTVVRTALDSHAYGETISVKIYRVEGLNENTAIDEIGAGQYIDIDVPLFQFDQAA